MHIILLGAGAMIPWGAPTTIDITEAICNDKSFRTISNQSLGGWFLNKLRHYYHVDPESVNFETIINAVDYLITFYASKYSSGYSEFKNQLPVFFEEKSDLYELLDFNGIYSKKGNMWSIEKNRYKSVQFWWDYEGFFKSVYKHFINIIINKIESYTTTSISYNDLNDLLKKYLTNLNAPVRLYTTNYDHVIPTISQLDFFEGFDRVTNKFDEKTVITWKGNCYYNLHGSVHYDYDFPDSVILSKDKCVYDFGSGASNSNDQDRKTLLNSNIISGYNKSARILQTPYSQFYHTFYQDCIDADSITIIGYSFGDKHINSAIRTGSNTKPKSYIKYITSMMYNEDETIRTNNDWITLDENKMTHSLIDDDCGIYNIRTKENNNDIRIFRKGFKEFLIRLNS